MLLYTAGYGRWSPDKRLERLIDALRGAGINTLVDVRHSPCSSTLSPESNYGPRDWHLQDAAQGLEGHLQSAGIDYLWLVELGNPQKNDPKMLILRLHLAESDRPWPVNRGLDLLNGLIREEGRVCCLLCACKDYDRCHRNLIAEALKKRYFEGKLSLRDLSG